MIWIKKFKCGLTGSEAVSLVKRDIQSEVDRLTKIFTDMSASITSATQDMVEKMKTLDMTNTAQWLTTNT